MCISQTHEKPPHQNLASSKYLLETITEESNATGISTNFIIKKGGGDKVEQNKSNGIYDNRIKYIIISSFYAILNIFRTYLY